MNRNALVLIVVVVVVTLMIVAGRHLARNGPAIAQSSSAVKGKPAPDFKLKDLDGKTVRLADLRGKAVLLNFWATWCPPCKEEIPWFVDLQKQYGPQGLQIVGVDMDDNPNTADIARFAADMKINYPVLLHTDAVADEYGGLEALPTTFYIGRDGTIVSRVFGLVSHADVEENIRAALRQGIAAVAEQQPSAESAKAPAR